VTNEVHRLFWPRRRAADFNFEDLSEEDAPDHAAVNLNWFDAWLFASWLGCRLPTEAQWEYMARAGSATRFWSGESVDDLDSVAWTDRTSRGRPHPVGAKPGNSWGLHDVHGQVWEWCADQWLRPASSAVLDPFVPWDPDPNPRAARVLRGGAWSSPPESCRSALRNCTLPHHR
ncbi:MAG: formylglycine-generating enzyme family protein, partial [Actinomycetia bacterium]|nr:formylglycine-generating enzyme family protein [Actinomycetes bacterium]